jgi:hypothetical protein
MFDLKIRVMGALKNLLDMTIVIFYDKHRQFIKSYRPDIEGFLLQIEVQKGFWIAIQNVLVNGTKVTSNVILPPFFD